MLAQTVFPGTIAGGDYFFFAPKGGDYSREAIIFRYCSLQVMLQIFCSILPSNQKLITSTKLNMGFLSVPRLVP